MSNINYYNISALEQYRNIMTILTANPRYIITVVDLIMRRPKNNYFWRVTHK